MAHTYYVCSCTSQAKMTITFSCVCMSDSPDKGGLFTIVSIASTIVQEITLPLDVLIHIQFDWMGYSNGCYGYCIFRHRAGNSVCWRSCVW